MVLKPCKKKRTLKKTKARPKLRPVNKRKSVYRKFSEEELEEFILNSYSGDFQPIKSDLKNFPFAPKRKNSKVIEDLDELQELAYKMLNIPAFSFDTETNSLRASGPNNKFRCVCITISWGEKDNYYIPLGHLRDEDIDADRNLDLEEAVKILKVPFENPYVLIVGNNLKFDMHVLARIGIHIKTTKLFDNQLASWICDENTPNGLKENSMMKMNVDQTHFKEVTNSIPTSVKKQFGYKANSKVYDFGLVLIDEGKDYAMDDSFFSWCLFLGFRKEIIDEEMDGIFYKKMVPFLTVLYKMEEQGVTVDIDRLEQMREDMTKDLEDLQYKIYELSGCEFNIGSNPQRSLLLFGIDNYSGSFEEYLEIYKKRQAKRIAKSGLDIEKVRGNYEKK